MRGSRSHTKEDIHQTAAITPLRMSDYFLILGSEHYTKSIEDPHDSEHIMLLSQIMAAKNANKPVIIFWIKGIPELVKEKLRNVLKGMNLIGEYESTGENPTEEDIIAIMKIMEEHPV